MLATTSVWSRDRVRPEIIRGTVAAYGKVRDNLLLHAPGFPTAETLLQTVKACRPELGMAAVGDGKSSDGSRLIVSVVDRSDPRPVWIGGWGGVNCLAQALWDVRRDRSPAQVAAFVGKLRVYAISDQDDAGYWLRRTFPELFYIVSPTTVEDPDYIRATSTGISSKSSPPSISSWSRTPGSHSTYVNTTDLSESGTRPSSTSWKATHRRSSTSFPTASPVR